MNNRPPDEALNGDPRVEWSAAERAAIERLRAAAPPADLEESVVAALAGRGLVGSGDVAAPGGVTGGPREPRTPKVPTHRAWAWGALALAACAAAFFAGISVSDRGAGRGPATPPALERYLLLLYEDESYRAPVTPAEQEARVAEYSAWVSDLRERRIEVDGDELAPPSEADRLDGRRDAVEATRGGPTGAAGSLTGYFVVEASDRAAVVAIARTTPHLKHGGTVVVRQVVRH
ncbi:MAG TPA: hypothetical protein VEY33_04230 [Gemmatimonadota bacterium]|nr:hypothetical protein [Gemmatimonadota bacterium]